MPVILSADHTLKPDNVVSRRPVLSIAEGNLAGRRGVNGVALAPPGILARVSVPPSPLFLRSQFLRS
jgi:hypothetical protein